MKAFFPTPYKAPQNKNILRNISILSHNVFWFQGAPFATDAPPAPCSEIMRQLCALYRRIAPDILCLQEIQSVAAAEPVAAELGMEYLFRSGGSYGQYGGVVLSRWPMEEVLLSQGFMPDRILLQVKVHPEKAPPFRLVNIHLPSNRQRGLEGGRKQRLLELSQVLEQVDILAGDFNERPDDQCATLLREKKFVDAAEACFAGEFPSNLGTYRGDQVWLTREKANALQGYFVVPKEQLATSIKGKKYLSDHLPVGCLLSYSEDREN